MPELVDSRGKPLRVAKADLNRPFAMPTVSGIRQIWDFASAANGLTPESLAALLRQADQGDGRAYLQLAMEMEQREAHYRSVLGTRKRAVTRLPVTVESASDDAPDVALADEVRALLRAPGFRGMLGHALDGLGKGFGLVELRWDTSRTPWVPRDRTDPKTGERIRGYQWIDPRWCTYDRATGRQLRLRDDSDSYNGIALPPYRYILHEPELMSGLPLGAGLARVATVAYLAKTYTLKDWLAFAEIYGMPLRLGKYGPGASEEDIGVLVSAVANLGTDAAAVIPESMLIEFIEAAKTASADVFRGLAEWADKQLSKLVLGQVASTEGQPGSLGAQVAQDEVREDIRDADAEELADTLNRDLVGAYLALNHGPMDPEDAPRIVIAAPDAEDVKALTDSLKALVPLGMRVGASVVRDRLGWPDPEDDEEVLGAPAAAPEPEPEPKPKREQDLDAVTRALNRAAGPAAAAAPDVDPAVLARLRDQGQAALGGMLDQVRAILAAAGSMEEAAAMIEAAYPRLDAKPLAAALAAGRTVANLAGRADVLEEVAAT